MTGQKERQEFNLTLQMTNIIVLHESSGFPPLFIPISPPHHVPDLCHIFHSLFYMSTFNLAFQIFCHYINTIKQWKSSKVAATCKKEQKKWDFELTETLSFVRESILISKRLPWGQNINIFLVTIHLHIVLKSFC